MPNEADEELNAVKADYEALMASNPSEEERAKAVAVLERRGLEALVNKLRAERGQ